MLGMNKKKKIENDIDKQQESVMRGMMEDLPPLPPPDGFDQPIPKSSIPNYLDFENAPITDMTGKLSLEEQEKAIMEQMDKIKKKKEKIRKQKEVEEAIRNQKEEMANAIQQRARPEVTAEQPTQTKGDSPIQVGIQEEILAAFDARLTRIESVLFRMQ